MVIFVCVCIIIAIVDCTGTKIKIKFLSLNELKGQDAVNNLGTLYLPPWFVVPPKTLPWPVHVQLASMCTTRAC